MASEIRIPHADFDKKYFITTDFPNHLEQALASGDLLAHLQQLFALPIKSLHVTSSEIWCIIQGHDFQEANLYYSKHIDLLEKISQASDADALKHQGAASPRNFAVIALGFICIHAGVLTLGIFGALPTFADTLEMVDVRAWIITGVLFGSVSAAVWLLVFLTVLRKTSWVSWVFADFLLCGVIGFVLSGIFVVREANAHLPQPPAVIYEQPIQERVCTLKCSERCGKRCTRTRSYRFQSDMLCSPETRQSIRAQKQQSDTVCANRAYFEYTISVPHWRDSERYSFSPSQKLFDSAKTGSFLKVPVNRGALGLEWVDISQIRAD